MKKIVTGVLSFALAFSLVACTSDAPKGSTSESTGAPSQSESESEQTSEETTVPETELPTDTLPGDSEEPSVSDDDLSGSDEEIEQNDTALLLSEVWNSVPEDKQFPVAGGDYNHTNMSGAGSVLSSETDYLCGILLFPEEYTGEIGEAASLGHMMNQNMLTSGLFLMNDGSDNEAIAKAFEDSLDGVHWLCGFPEEYLVMQVDADHLYIAYGHSDNIDAVRDAFTGLYADSVVLAEGSIS